METSFRTPHSGAEADRRLNAQERGAEWPYLPTGIAFLTGTIDIIGVLTLGRFTSANITLDMLAVSSGLAPSHHLPPLQLLAIPVFFIGVVAVYFLAQRFGSASTVVVRSVLLAQFLLLAFVCAFSETQKHALSPESAPAVIIGVTLVLVIGLSNMCMHLLDDQAATTWALTANCVIAAIALLNIATKHGSEADRAKDRQRWRSLWPVIACFLLGGFGGTVSVSYLHQQAWSVPAAISLMIVVLMKKKPLPQQTQKQQTQKQQTQKQQTEMRTP